MKRAQLWTLMFSILPTTVLAQIPYGPYLGQKPPGPEAKVFAPGLVSLPNRRDGTITFSPDGQECFVGTVINHVFTFLYTKREHGHWSNLVQPDSFGTQDKREPFLSPDGQRLFFTGYPADIWMSRKVKGRWSAPSRVPSPVSTAAEEWHPTVTLDGTLYFSSSRNAPPDLYFIYRSRLEDGVYKRVEKLDTTINSPHYGAWDPYIAPDESYMLFGSSRPDGYGNFDLYVSNRTKDNSWTPPKNLGAAVNTIGIEYGSYVTPDGKYYFFSRPVGWGPDKEADLYWIDIRALPLAKHHLNESPKSFELKQRN